MWVKFDADGANNDLNKIKIDNFSLVRVSDRMDFMFFLVAF